jgi:hypothetical protein
VPAAGIVEAVDVLEEGNFDLSAGEPVSAPDQFGLEGFEEAFDGRVVITISLAAHRRHQTMVSQGFLVVMGAVLGGFNRSSQHL